MYIFDFPYPVGNTTNVSFPSTIDLIADNCFSLKWKPYFGSIDDNAVLISIFSPGLLTTEDASAHSQNREEIRLVLSKSEEVTDIYHWLPSSQLEVIGR
jgi:hypothetical protein